MDRITGRIRQQIDVMSRFLTPFLPFANCHMVEYFTSNHWDIHLTKPVKSYIENEDLENLVEIFWKAALKPDVNDVHCEISNFVANASAHTLKPNEEFCLTLDKFKEWIKKCGGIVQPEIELKQFMCSKKLYEVQVMSPLTAALHNCYKTSHCVDIGGGRGQLPIVLASCYRIPSITIDCDTVALDGGKKREPLMQKQWQSIAKRQREICNTNINHNNLHTFVNTFITKESNLENIVKMHSPDCDIKTKLLITGLHTCGNLGPDSLHIFTTQDTAAVLFNVPCCYHLLTENVDQDHMWSPFEKCCLDIDDVAGFPMSQYMKGYQLGRNARMLAAQSIERVAKHKQLPNKSLLYRAILEVIIKERLKCPRAPEGKLKKIAAKSFHEYLQTAAHLLKLDVLSNLPNEYISDLLKRYENKWKNLVMFYLLRMSLAQVIESIILLDRLLYLREHKYMNSFLVKLFDPVLSPRCHAIVQHYEYRVLWNKYGLPWIFGAIDCTHVAIFPPNGPTKVCDVNCRIIQINARFPGRVYDQYIFTNSTLREEMKRLYEQHVGRYFLLGDSGYALEPWLLTPDLDAADGSAGQRYTQWHCQVRNAVERCNGYLKGTFRCLGHDRVLHYGPEKASTIIYTCAIICIQYNAAL